MAVLRFIQNRQLYLVPEKPTKQRPDRPGLAFGVPGTSCRLCFRLALPPPLLLQGCLPLRTPRRRGRPRSGLSTTGEELGVLPPGLCSVQSSGLARASVLSPGLKVGQWQNLFPIISLDIPYILSPLERHSLHSSSIKKEKQWVLKEGRVARERAGDDFSDCSLWKLSGQPHL